MPSTLREEVSETHLNSSILPLRTAKSRLVRVDSHVFLSSDTLFAAAGFVWVLTSRRSSRSARRARSMECSGCVYDQYTEHKLGVVQPVDAAVRISERERELRNTLPATGKSDVLG